jgi:hypothetical protein
MAGSNDIGRSCAPAQEKVIFLGGFGRAATDQVPVYNPVRRPSNNPIASGKQARRTRLLFRKVSLFPGASSHTLCDSSSGETELIGKFPNSCFKIPCSFYFFNKLDSYMLQFPLPTLIFKATTSLSNFQHVGFPLVPNFPSWSCRTPSLELASTTLAYLMHSVPSSGHSWCFRPA